MDNSPSVIALKMVTWIRQNFLRIFFAFFLIFIIYFSVFVIKPFDVKPDPEADDVSTAWNDAIARLGIASLFPPQEDFYVGDVWAVIANTEDTPLLGKSVRIGHIELSPGKRRFSRPLFPDTSPLVKEQEYTKQDPVEITEDGADGKIRLNLTAFPGVTISRTIAKRASIAVKYLNFNAGSDDSIVDELRIPVAETYGAPAGESIGALSKWCRNDDTKLFCTDAYTRRLLAFSISDKILNNGALIQLRLVTRVFLMRRIEQRRRQGNNAGSIATIEFDGSGVVKPANGKDTDTNSDTGSGSEAPTVTPAKAPPTYLVLRGQKSNGFSFSAASALDVSILQTFQRPLVFGFRTVSLNLEPDGDQGKATK
ncbi:hypothetical protein [Methylobacterium sp. Leaf469]|uniref:hypothetical protein n=1 Tax=Methylobacterium sp. Leaf469 TaxID=1736387 RepID=UPI000A737C5B|nr:hypothetical protein [Methylobacterium sp. Leaf469]